MNVSKINPCSFSENPFKKKILGKLGWIFFIGKHLLNGEERKKISHGYYSHHFQKWGRFDFK